jgi:hypothetical protein
MTVYNFTGANGDPLPAGLTAQNGTFEIQDNKLAPSGSDPSGPKWVCTQQSEADATISAVFNNNNDTAGTTGVLFRYSDNNNYWMAVIRGSQSDAILFKAVDGSLSNVGSYNIPTSAANSNFLIEVVTAGDGIQVDIDSTPAISLTDSFNNTATLHGVRMGSAGHRIDDLSIPTVAGADVTPPVITLLGDASVTVTEGDTYTDAGATASDDVDGNITANIATVNPVDTNTPAVYTVTYNVSDSAGNAATEVTRTVTVQAAAAGTISIDNNPFQQAWSRNQSNNASVTITGTYTGTPAIIERSVDGGAFVTAVGSPSGGVFADTFTLAVGEHDITYRFSNETSVTATLTPVVVGEVVVPAGQSNASSRGSNNQTFTNSAGGVTAYLLGNDDEFGVLQDPYDSNLNQVDSVSSDSSAGGSWIVRYANEWLENNEIPLIVIPVAKGGSSIAEWARSTSASTLYGSMKRRVDAVGGCNQIFWQQGERDSADAVATSGAVYQAALVQLAADFKSDFDCDTWVVALQTITASSYSNQAVIRQAQIDAAAQSVNIEIGQPMTDIDLSGGDGLHFREDSELELVAQRTYSDFIAGTTQPNQAPTANAGANQSVAAGVNVVLDGSASSDPEDGNVTQYGWEQISGPSVTLLNANTATPSFTAPSSLTQQTLRFRLTTLDSEGLNATDTVDVVVAAIEENAILATMETLDFELVTQGDVVAYKGRANREVMQLKPSSTAGVITDGGYLDLTQNSINKIEIIADGEVISNDNSDAIKVDGTKILARLGDLNLNADGRSSISSAFTIVFYVGSDTRGLVVAATGTKGYRPLGFRDSAA